MAHTTQLPADLSVLPKYAAFNVRDTSYKEVNGTPIPVSVLTPKNVTPGKHPVMVRWHGGGLITGHRLLPDHFSDWLLDLAAKNDAIIVCPDYRLMPEVNGLEIMKDLRDFYSWLLASNNLTAHLPAGVEPDLQHLLVVGESAGGWASLQAGMFDKVTKNIAAIIAQYPMIDMRDRWYTEDFEKAIFDPPAPQVDRKVLRDYLANMTEGEVITSAIPPSRGPIIVSLLQQGKFGEVFGDDSSLYPIEMLDVVDAMPPTWILHGIDDSAVPIAGTYKYVTALKEKVPSAKLHTSYRPGNHGFDQIPQASLDEDWMKDGVAFIHEFWPKC